MRKLVLISFLLLSSSGVWAQQYLLQFNSLNEFHSFMKWSPERVPLVSCHRGGPGAGFPENAIETFANSIKHHASVIECDAALTKDSVLMMMHDNRLERTSDGTGLVSDKTAAELRKLKLKDIEGTLTDFHIPSLDEVLQWGRGKVIYTLDIKRGVPYKMMIDAVRRNKAEAYSIIITYNAEQAAEVHRLAPELMISASVHQAADLERLNKMGIPDNRVVAFVGVSVPDQEVYQLLHERGIWCILGTMGNLDNSAKAKGDTLYQAFIRQGADILSSDRSIEAGKALAEFAEKYNLSTPHLRVIH